MMGPTEVPSQSPDTTIKIPTAHYEFGANYFDPKVAFLVIYIWLSRRYENDKY